MIISMLYFIISLELLFIWIIYYGYINDVKFYFSVFCAFTVYICFGKASSITMSRNNGEIIKEVFIGYKE